MADEKPNYRRERTRLNKLIARLEAASEGDRVLDRAIRAELGLPIIAGFWAGEAEANPYTSSVDAALTLVPAGFGVHLSIGGNDLARDGLAWCQDDRIGTTESPVPHPPALAICIAAIKARII